MVQKVRCIHYCSYYLIVELVRESPCNRTFPIPAALSSIVSTPGACIDDCLRQQYMYVSLNGS